MPLRSDHTFQVTEHGSAAPGKTATSSAPLPARVQPGDAVERALSAAISDASRIGDLLDTLRTARLWLPLPDDGAPATDGTAVRLPTVCYLGSDFVPAYTSADLLARLAGQDSPARPGRAAAAIPHIVVRAADLARLMPPDVGIAINAGASQSVPVYPQGVSYLAADEPANERRVSVGPLPAQPEALLAGIAAGLSQIPQASQGRAGWLSVQFAGEGLLISVTLDDPADGAVRDQVIAALEHAAREAWPQPAYPIDVTFPGEGEPDHIDQWIATAAAPFYTRAERAS
ncbi:MAG TPA: SseB family protein [Streptosporangiaceae bacterium]|nr:SseB family protein [Streptosporangiaceae bacterium]